MRRAGGFCGVELRHGAHVRLVGREIWEGTLQR